MSVGDAMPFVYENSRENQAELLRYKIRLPVWEFNHFHAQMIFIYRLLFFPIFLVLLLKNLPKMWRRGGYRKHLAHRFGFLPKKAKGNKPRIWVQAVSVGEINAIKNLIKILSND